MFDQSTIIKLKQNNISVDGEKTKQRVYELWKNASNEEKQTVENLADVARTTIYRIYKTGSISAKLAVPLAQTLGVDPYYLIGEADERGECNDELLRDFLIRFGYKELLSESEPKATRRRIKKVKAERPSAAVEADNSASAEAVFPENAGALKQEECKEETGAGSDIINILEGTQANIDDMTEDDMILLMRSILLRAKFGGNNASELAKKLKTLLLS